MKMGPTHSSHPPVRLFLILHSAQHKRMHIHLDAVLRHDLRLRNDGFISRLSVNPWRRNGYEKDGLLSRVAHFGLGLGRILYPLP